MDTMTTTIRPIPLDQLSVSAHNARTIDREPLDELAASIAAEGLLQNLTVIAGDGEGYEVIAGKRRLGALQLLRERGELPAGLDAPPCRIVDDERALSASLAENVVRKAMHPADEFVAFRRLAESGRSCEDIAQEFGVMPVVVQRRLRLANVAPSLFALFQRDEIALDQMMALAVTEDHAAQEAAWNVPDEWERQPRRIKDRLTKSEVNVARDKAARFVGMETLADAGVVVRRDLFSDRGEGYTDDRLLIDQLALDKLEHAADAVRDEGWSWVEARIEHARYIDGRPAFDTIHPATDFDRLTASEAARLDELRTEAAAIEDAVDDPGEDEWDRLQGIQDEIEALERRAETWTTKQLAAAGVIVTIASDGSLEILRGQVRHSDRKAAKAASSSSAANPAPEKPDLSAPMLLRLGAQRTSMIQTALLEHRDVALALLAHTLLLGAFFPDATYQSRPSRIRFAGPEDLEKHASELPMMRHHAVMQETRAGLAKSLPAATALLAWLLDQPRDIVVGLLAAVSAQSIAAYIDTDKASQSVNNELIAALGIDFADGWEPTRETFLDHVPRAVIEEAVREARGDADAAKLAGLKKNQLIDAAEQLLAGKRWLPKPLRGSTPKTKDPAAKKSPAKPKRKAQGKGTT